jgi:hypothetical protein
LPKLLVDQTEKKKEMNKLLGDIQSPDGQNMDVSNMTNKDIDNLIDQLNSQKSNFLDQVEEVKWNIDNHESEINYIMSVKQKKHELQKNPELTKIRAEVENLSSKRDAHDTEVKSLRSMLFQIDETISMTKEDLMSKLLQRADFVAQREEFDEMYDVNRRSQGNDFTLYCDLQDTPNWQKREKYQNAKCKKFYLDILNQLKSFSQNKDSTSESGSDLEN